MTARQEALGAVQRLLFPRIARLYAIGPDDLRLHPDYNGCQNLVFFYTRAAAHRVLRVSFRDDRPPDQVLAELDFIRYLHENRVRASPPVASRHGRCLAVIASGASRFAVVSFEPAPGHRLPDKGYRYRAGAAIDEYSRKMSWPTTRSPASSRHRTARSGSAFNACSWRWQGFPTTRTPTG